MSSLFHLLVTPIILFISIPLTIFAAFTTTLAIYTLSIRAILVNFDLISALLYDWLHSHTNTYPQPPPSSPLKPVPNPERTPSQPRRKSRRGSAASFSSTTTTSSSLSPPTVLHPTAGFGIYTSTSAATTRDFEGVGGWRIPGPDADEDELWTGLNSRLELPSIVDERNRHHHRSRTLGSNVASVSVPPKSPGLGGRTPTGSGSGGGSSRMSGGEWASAEGYFACENRRTSSKSTTALTDATANIGKVILRHKPSSSSSGSSTTQGSTRTMQLTLSNG